MAAADASRSWEFWLLWPPPPGYSLRDHRRQLFDDWTVAPAVAAVEVAVGGRACVN